MNVYAHLGLELKKGMWGTLSKRILNKGASVWKAARNFLTGVLAPHAEMGFGARGG
jgi:hypothetical protein